MAVDRRYPVFFGPAPLNRVGGALVSLDLNDDVEFPRGVQRGYGDEIGQVAVRFAVLYIGD